MTAAKTQEMKKEKQKIALTEKQKKEQVKKKKIVKKKKNDTVKKKTDDVKHKVNLKTAQEMKKKTKSRDTAFKKTIKKTLKHTKNVQKMTTVIHSNRIQKREGQRLPAHESEISAAT
ncbi:MAG: hypothetical protein M1836_004248 [Candelina mexicana]|nr:MAG: hypothetical protein M1836_004248 [Candelina mexicana]